MQAGVVESVGERVSAGLLAMMTRELRLQNHLDAFGNLQSRFGLQ